MSIVKSEDVEVLKNCDFVKDIEYVIHNHISQQPSKLHQSWLRGMDISALINNNNNNNNIIIIIIIIIIQTLT